jgi:hypothetical protein
MNDAAVIVADLHTGLVLKRFTGIPTPREVAAARTEHGVRGRARFVLVLVLVLA